MTATHDEAQALVAEFAGYEDSDLRDLIERAAQLHELTLHPGWALFVDLVTAQTVSRQNLILAGACKTLEDYAAQTGWIKGAMAAIDGPAMVNRKLENLREQIEEEQEANSPTEREMNDAA